MLKTLQKRDTAVRILLGVVVVFVGGAMVITLVPGTVGTLGDSRDVVARVGSDAVTVQAIYQQLSRLTRGQSIPEGLRPFYNRQVFDQMLNQRLLAHEAERLGIRVTDAERTEAIREALPTVFPGGQFLGMEAYTGEVQQRFEMTVAEFEDLVDQDLLQRKFVRLVTDGVTVTAAEIEQEFRLRNEKVRLDYAVVRPAELAATLPAPEAELAEYFRKNESRYQLPQKRSIRYVLLDREELARGAQPGEAELREYYNAHLESYRVQDRARISRILFNTLNKTDAEVEEVRRKAEDVLRQARTGAKFEDLARRHSEDKSKEVGGDLGWIVRGQAVPEIERAAFSLPPGTVSDLLKTAYAFEIVKVTDREMARTRSFEEVRDSIVEIVRAQKAEQQAAEAAEKLAAAVRRSTRRPIEEVAAEMGLPVRETRPVSMTETLPELGSSLELQQAIFRLRPGELSAPMETPRGPVVFTVKEDFPARQGTLAEVRERVADDYRREKSVELARTRAEELARRAAGGESLAAAARAMGLEVKTTEPLNRTANLPDGLGSARQLVAAFSMPVGGTGPATAAGENWMVYRVAAREEPRPEALLFEGTSLREEILRSKQSMAFESFLEALRTRMLQEGTLRVNEETLARLTRPPQDGI